MKCINDFQSQLRKEREVKEREIAGKNKEKKETENRMKKIKINKERLLVVILKCETFW